MKKGEKRTPVDFLTTQSTPLKRILPKPQGPQLLCIYVLERPQKKMNIHYLLDLSLALLRNCFFVFCLIMHIYIKTIANCT